MKTRKISQRKMTLMLLKENAGEYLPTWWFVGERYSDTLRQYVLLSYKVPTRLTELYQEGLVERRMTKGRSGASYYEYKYKEE